MQRRRVLIGGLGGEIRHPSPHTPKIHFLLQFRPLLKVQTAQNIKRYISAVAFPLQITVSYAVPLNTTARRHSITERLLGGAVSPTVC